MRMVYVLCYRMFSLTIECVLLLTCEDGLCPVRAVHQFGRFDKAIFTMYQVHTHTHTHTHTHHVSGTHTHTHTPCIRYTQTHRHTDTHHVSGTHKHTHHVSGTHTHTHTCTYLGQSACPCLLSNVLYYYRMCSLTTECVILLLRAECVSLPTIKCAILL